MVRQRGFWIPANLHTDRLRSVPPGYIYQVIKNGYGAMPDHGDQIPVNDRWAIVAYLRALQLSRDANVSDVPPDVASAAWSKMTTSTYYPSPELHDDLSRWLRPALGIGIALSAASVIGAFFSPGDFFRSYLMGYLFWLGLTLGSLGIVMMQYLTAGAWGIMTRRTLESATRTLPLLALLFIPIAFGIPRLYDWAHPNLVQHEYVLRHRAVYMNPTMFIVRAIDLLLDLDDLHLFPEPLVRRAGRARRP